MQSVNPIAIADGVLLQERHDVAVAIAERVRVEAAMLRDSALQYLATLSPAVVETPTLATAGASTLSHAESLTPRPRRRIDWDCVATAETGGDWQMTGPQYSTALGIMDQAVRENTTEEIANRVFAGIASRDEQIQIAESIVAKFGFNAWAPSTVVKCS